MPHTANSQANDSHGAIIADVETTFGFMMGVALG